MSSFIILAVYLILVKPLFFQTSTSFAFENPQIYKQSLLPDQIAVVQFDSRPLKDYWLVSANWNYLYCLHHGHKYIYYSLQSENDCHYEGELLAAAWCKVKAMIEATKKHPNIKLFLYMDSDAVVSMDYYHVSLVDMFVSLETLLGWRIDEKSLLFNQDGPCWWCNLIQKVGYTMCLNSGTVMWYRTYESLDLLEKWWHSSMDPYSSDPLKRKFRKQWPWEQDRQMAIYYRYSNKIQIASHPSKVMMPMVPGSRRIEGGLCLSHLPGSGCYIEHYCASPKSKQVLRERYHVNYSIPKDFEIHKLDVDNH